VNAARLARGSLDSISQHVAVADKESATLIFVDEHVTAAQAMVVLRSSSNSASSSTPGTGAYSLIGERLLALDTAVAVE
jgi:hypothetical protein